MPTVIADRFELLAEAARGGMGSVHRARDRRTGAMVAVKVLSLSGPFDLVRFEREGNVLAGLHHPNVVRYVAHGSTPDGIHFLVQEWVDGITLSTQLQTLGLAAPEALEVGIGVGEALGAAHALGVVHRDVKPANIILDAGAADRIKLVDFGIARMASDAGVLTRTGVLIGTPSYMAPEQARGSVVIEPPADVWALGCVLYEALAGRKAFSGRTPEAVRAKVLLHEPERLDALCPEAPAELAALVHAMLAKRATDRPRTGGEAAAALLALRGRVRGGPPRRVGAIDQKPTQVMPMTPRQVEATPGAAGAPGARAFVFVSVPPPEEDAPPRGLEQVKRISDRHNLELHQLEDGSVLLSAQQAGRAGAVEAAYAAIEIQEEIFDGAISVFARAADESLEAAIDRGSEALAEVTMAALFAGVVEADATIRVDPVVAELVHGELDVIETEGGRMLQARKSS